MIIKKMKKPERNGDKKINYNYHHGDKKKFFFLSSLKGWKWVFPLKKNNNKGNETNEIILSLN